MRNVELSLESGDQLDVRNFNILETLSAAFRIDVIARAADDAIDFAKITGHPATFKINGESGGRTWTGVVAHVAQTHVEPEGLSTYSIQLAPTFWLLTHRKGHRVFQHLSAPDIVKKILAEWKIQPIVKLKHSYPKLPMRTQYGESDHDFVRRILAEAGISFFFHGAEGEETKLVLTDAPQDGEPRGDAPVPFARDTSGAQGAAWVSGVQVSSKVVPGKSTARDYDFRRPRYALDGNHAHDASPHPLLEDYRYTPGHSLTESSGGEAVADREGSYRHNDDAAGGEARRRAEAHRAGATKIGFSTSLLDLSPGTIFAMDGHPHPEVAKGKKLLVTHAYLNGEPTGEWHGGGEAAPADRPHRPSVEQGAEHGAPSAGSDDPFQPLAKLNKPRIYGLQSAIVTGPAGEDVHTDEHGRVKLQFPWDREGKFDDKSSPWVRVAQASAGAGFGHMSIPRVGQEVLVGYHDGDPDHPVVVGRMHNATAPVPYALPEHKSRTSFKSNSAAGANEITFDDKQDGELFFVQAQKDLHKIVKQDELEHTQGNRHVHVDGDLVLSAKGKVIIHAGGDLVVKGGPHVKINPVDKPKEGKKPKPLSAQKAPAQKPAAGAGASAGSGGDANERLKGMNPGNRPQSAADAAYHKKAAEKYQADAIKLGKKHNVPPALILGMMSRESNFGASLDKNGRGDHGHGFGILQVDDGTIKNPAGGPYSYEHMDQAMGIFDDKLSEVKAAHPGWSADEQLAGAVSAYNQGSGNVATRPSDLSGWGRMDSTTTGHDYSMDTWARAQWYADNLKW